MKNLTLIAFSLVILLGCRKNKYESFTLKVVEYGTKKPIEGARVEVYNLSIYGIGSTRMAHTKIGEVITDKNGDAFIDGSGERPDRMYVFTDDMDYFDADHGGAGIVSYLQEEIELYPYAWVKIQVDWSVFKGEFDYIRLSRLPGCHPVGCSFAFSSDSIVGPLRVFGNANNNAIISGYKAGKDVEIFPNPNVFSPAFDTVIFTLHR